MTWDEVNAWLAARWEGEDRAARSVATGAGLTSRALRGGSVPRWLRDRRAGRQARGRDSRPVVGIDPAGDGAMAVLEPDGRVTIYDSNGQKVWPDPDPVTKAYVDARQTFEQYRHRLAVNPLWRETVEGAQAAQRVKRQRFLQAYGLKDRLHPIEPVTKEMAARMMQRYRDTYPEIYAALHRAYPPVKTLDETVAEHNAAEPNISISPDDGETGDPYGYVKKYLDKAGVSLLVNHRPAEGGVPERWRIAWRQDQEAVMMKNPAGSRDIVISVFDEEGNDMVFQASWAVTSEDINLYVMDPSLTRPRPGYYHAIVVA